MLVTQWQYVENGILRHYFSEATCTVDVDVLNKNSYQNFIVNKYV